MRLGLIAISVCLATGCGGGGAAPAAREGRAGSESGTGTGTGTGAGTGAGAGAGSGTGAGAVASVAQLESLAAGRREHVDPARGVSFVRYFSDTSGEDPDADADGIVRSATHACGEALDRNLARLARDLTMRFEDEAWRTMMECEGAICRIPAMGEYDLSGELTFVRSGDRLVLDRVVRIEGGPVTEDFVEAGERWAAERVAALRGSRCD